VVTNAISAAAKNPFAKISIPIKTKSISIFILYSMDLAVKAEILPYRSTRYISVRIKSLLSVGKATAILSGW
jgi:hypothetical protein